MKMTIVTLFRAYSGDHFVSAVEGELTEAQKTEIAESFSLSSDDDMSDLVGFVVVDVAAGLESVTNAFPDGSTFEAGENGVKRFP